KARHIYGANHEPWNILDQDSPESFWVLTKLNKKSKSRIERTAGDGCWLQQFAKEVKNKDGGEVIGDLVICEIKNKDAAVVSSGYKEKSRRTRSVS
ncbi:hypothetical protein Goklo_000550, partial [Gossypium klotzschianum]|nr:hypothetical protein [Gossypium klotzschianum]